MSALSKPTIINQPIFSTMSEMTFSMSSCFIGVKGLFISSKLTKISPPSSRISKQPLLGFSGLTTTFTPATSFSNPFLTCSALVLNDLHCLQCSMMIDFGPSTASGSDDGEAEASRSCSAAAASVLVFFFLGGFGSAAGGERVPSCSRGDLRRADLAAKEGFGCFRFGAILKLQWKINGKETFSAVV